MVFIREVDFDGPLGFTVLCVSEAPGLDLGAVDCDPADWAWEGDRKVVEKETLSAAARAKVPTA